MLHVAAHLAVVASDTVGFAAQLTSISPWGEAAEPTLQSITTAFATALSPVTGYSTKSSRRPSVVQVSPRGGDSAGNISIVVVGAGFIDYGDVKCQFCSAIVRGRVLHDRAISCPVPSWKEAGHSRASLPASCTVRVSLNGVDFVGSHGATFRYDYSLCWSCCNPSWTVSDH